MGRRDRESIPIAFTRSYLAKPSSVYRFMGDCYGEQLQRASEYLALMATQNQLLPVGQWVQYNAGVQDPRSNAPSPAEQTIGVIRQAFTKSDGTYYQVVWNPGSVQPVTAMYHQDQLNPLDQQTASQIRGELAAGTYQPPQQTPGSDYQQPNIPVQAAPPSQQQPGEYTL